MQPGRLRLEIQARGVGAAHDPGKMRERGSPSANG